MNFPYMDTNSYGGMGGRVFFIKFAFLLNSLRQKVPFYSPGVFSVTLFSDFRRCSPLSDAVINFVSYTKILFKFAQ